MGVFRGTLVFSLLTLPWALGFFALDADGPFSIHDSIIYGVIAETEPGWQMNPHHPGFHALQSGIQTILGAVGVEHPGFMAARVLAGIGAALALALIAAMAGGRILVGIAAALAFASARIISMETAVGETNLPGIAAALWMFREALALRPRSATLIASITVALWMREDSILLLPGVLTAAAAGFEPLQRWRRVAGITLAAGVLTLAGYILAFQFVDYMHEGRAIRFTEWLVLYAHVPQMAITHSVGFERLATYAGSLGAATVGQFDGDSWFSFALGMLWCGAFLAAAVLGRGCLPSRRMLVGVALMLAVRLPFFTWFEPENCEWHALHLALLACMVAAAMATPKAKAWPLVAVAVLLLVALATACVTAPGLTRLRARTLMTGVEEVVAAAGRDATFVVLTNDRAAHALRYLHLYPVIQQDEVGAMAEITRRVRENAPVVFLTDRTVGNALPWRAPLEHRGGALLDKLRHTPGLEGVRWFSGPGGLTGALSPKR